MDEETCGRCRYFRDVRNAQNGLTYYMGTCVVELYASRGADAMDKAEVYSAYPNDDPCEDYEERP